MTILPRPVVVDPWLATTIVLALALLVITIVVARNLRRQRRYLERLRRGAERFARGKLDQRISVEGPTPLLRVAAAMNRMAEQLNERFGAAVRQRSHLEAVLSSMVEGVIAVDADGRIMTFNAAAGRLFDLDPRFSIDRDLVEVVRNAQLDRLLVRSIAEPGPIQGEVVLSPSSPAGGDERVFQVTATILHDARDQRIGSLLVFNEVTQLRRLENVRRDFVANVSHEMRTPLTAIKAAAETLLEDEHESSDPPSPRSQSAPGLPGASGSSFLHIIQRNADRMSAIIEDLLMLARLESQGEQPKPELEPGPVAPVLYAAAEVCQAAARGNGIDVRIEVEPGLVARMDRVLLEQAVVNLLDNAIKYGPAGEEVELSARRAGAEIVIAVHNSGEGIGAEHLSRIFERFYRIDKGRSRRMGSTGLGLSIVRHICQHQGGRVTVESEPGQGSTFRIHLPGSGATNDIA